MGPGLGPLLEPQENHTIDLAQAVREQSVVYFRLESDRWPLLANMIANAIISDLTTIVADLGDQPIPTAVLIDEFSAIGAGFIARLFGRARSAGFSLILATQELADLQPPSNSSCATRSSATSKR